MNRLNPYGAIKPDSRRFAEYLDQLKSHWIAVDVRPQRINAALALLREIERLRLCFSKAIDAAFLSRKIANAALAASMGYKTNRQVQKLRQWLEEQGVIVVRRQMANGFFNKWNSYLLAGFRDWFIQRYQQPSRKTGHPKEENDLRSLFGKKPNFGICFPKENLTAWCKATHFWRVIALEISGSLPCLSRLSEKFRLNLRKHQIPLDDASIVGRWKSFVKRAAEFHAKTGEHS